MQIVNCDDSVSDVSQLQTHLHCRISQSSFFFFWHRRVGNWDR